jgi:hypothetical protein
MSLRTVPWYNITILVIKISVNLPFHVRLLGCGDSALNSNHLMPVSIRFGFGPRFCVAAIERTVTVIPP